MWELSNNVLYDFYHKGRPAQGASKLPEFKDYIVKMDLSESFEFDFC